MIVPCVYGLLYPVNLKTIQLPSLIYDFTITNSRLSRGSTAKGSGTGLCRTSPTKVEARKSCVGASATIVKMSLVWV